MDAQKLYEERELLLRLQAGDERAFEILYRLHSRTIYRKILSMVKVADIADELTQRLFVKVWQKRGLIDPDKNFIIYVLQVAGNLVIDFYRKIARDEKLLDEVIALSTELYSHTEEELIYKESKAAIDNAIAALPPQQKQVFTLCKLEGKSYAEVGEMLGISTSTVSNHIVQATKTMKLLVARSINVVGALLIASILYS